MIKFKPFDYKNFKKLEPWYEEMARDGWLIKKVYINAFHVFEHTSQEDINIRVIATYNYRELSSISKDEEKEFRKMTEESGWHFLCRQNNVEIYQVDDPETNIFDSLETEQKVIMKNATNKIKDKIFRLASLLFIIYMFFSEMGNLANILFKSNLIAIFAITLVVDFVLLLLSLIQDLRFKYRNKNKIFSLEEIVYNGFVITSIIKVFELIGIITWLIFIPLELFNIHNQGFETFAKILLYKLLILIAGSLLIWFIHKKFIESSNQPEGVKRLAFTVPLVILIILVQISLNSDDSSLDIKANNMEDVNIEAFPTSIFTKKDVLIEKKEDYFWVEVLQFKDKAVLDKYVSWSKSEDKKAFENLNQAKKVLKDLDVDMIYYSYSDNSLFSDLIFGKICLAKDEKVISAPVYTVINEERDKEFIKFIKEVIEEVKSWPESN